MKLTSAERRLAVNTARVMGLDLAGVDIRALRARTFGDRDEFLTGRGRHRNRYEIRA